MRYKSDIHLSTLRVATARASASEYWRALWMQQCNNVSCMLLCVCRTEMASMSSASVHYVWSRCVCVRVNFLLLYFSQNQNLRLAVNCTPSIQKYGIG